MTDRARDRFWIAEPSDMLEKLRHDRKRLEEGIRNLRDDPREAYYAAYDFFITAWATAHQWVDDSIFNPSLRGNSLFDLAQAVANGVKHPRGQHEHRPVEETYDEGDFSTEDFSNRDFDIDHLYLEVTEEEVQDFDPEIVRDGTEIPVLPLADRLVECLKQEIQEGST